MTSFAVPSCVQLPGWSSRCPAMPPYQQQCVVCCTGCVFLSVWYWSCACWLTSACTVWHLNIARNAASRPWMITAPFRRRSALANCQERLQLRWVCEPSTRLAQHPGALCQLTLYLLCHWPSSGGGWRQNFFTAATMLLDCWPSFLL